MPGITDHQIAEKYLPDIFHGYFETLLKYMFICDVYGKLTDIWYLFLCH